MSTRIVTATEGLQLERGSVVVCIPTGADDRPSGSGERALATTRAVLEHTDDSVPVVIAGSATRVAEITRPLSAETTPARVASMLCEPLGSDTQAVNEASLASVPSDLVIVVPGVRVTTGWLERLRIAATSDSTVASATPLSLADEEGERVSVDSGDRVDLPAGIGIGLAAQDGARLEGQARNIAERSLHLLPRIAMMGPGCVYIRRATLELLGPLDESRSLDDALADLALRATAAGMIHVAADDVLVAGSYLTRVDPGSHDSLGLPAVASDVQETFDNDERGRLRRAVGAARIALRGLSVTIDGRALTAAIGGTQSYMLELILALAREGSVALRVLVAPDLSERAARALSTVPGIELLSYEQAVKGVRLTDVVHRPQPIFTPDDLLLLRMLGERVVIGQLDLISYHDYSYHSDVEHWRSYRRTTRLALGSADQVVFFSEHARRDALAEDLLPDIRAHVVTVGAEVLEPIVSSATRPDRVPSDQPFLLCLGADYAHKNRPFAVELVGALRELGWVGLLVLAGVHVPFGSSEERERELLRARPNIASSVVDLGPVDESSKQWLLAHTRALVYPTLYEGFGLLPLEAARAGVPCLFASQASLAEVGGPAATLIPWDATASAAAVLPLLADGPAREAHLGDLQRLSVPTWEEVARRLVSVYEHAIAAPPSEAAPRAWQELDRENVVVKLDDDVSHLTSVATEYQDAYHDLMARVGDGLPLIDRGGLLDEAQQRGLMRIAARRRLGALLLAPFGLLGRLGVTDAGSEPPDPPVREPCVGAGGED